MHTETKYHNGRHFPLFHVKNTLQMYVQCTKVQSIAIRQGLSLKKKKELFIFVLVQWPDNDVQSRSNRLPDNKRSKKVEE